VGKIAHLSGNIPAIEHESHLSATQEAGTPALAVGLLNSHCLHAHAGPLRPTDTAERPCTRNCSTGATEVVMVRIHHILCPVDLSEGSRHAFDRAVGVARCYDAKISILSVVPVAAVVPAIPFGPEGPGAFGVHPTEQRNHLLAEIPRFLALEHGIGTAVEYQVVEAPSVHREIIAQTERLGADLVVMGTHGRSGFERLVLGSITEKVLRTARVPVMTVPPHVADVVAAGRDPFRRIVYATDFSEGSEDALRYAASLAQHAAGQLTVIHVVQPFPVGQDPIVGTSFDVAAYHAEMEKQARAKLRTFVPESIRLGCDTDDVLVIGKPYREILRVAAERLADVIVLGVHGRHALDRLVFGSATEHLVRRATCPVLTVRTADRAH
jgi:nucleotide-binding universal stress UspA family protein